MTPQEYWPHKLKSKSATGVLIPVTFYYDFDWGSIFPTSRESWSRFQGMGIVHEVVKQQLNGRGWDSVVIIISVHVDEPVKYELLNERHFFVFHAERLKSRRYSATTAFLGGAASDAPEMLAVYQRYKSDPQALKLGMLSADVTQLIDELTREEAKGLLPMALRLLLEALGDVAPDLTVSPLESAAAGEADVLEGVDVEALTRALQFLLARARDRGDVSSVLQVLDALDDERRQYFATYPEVVKLVAEEQIETMEITSWAYRRRQLRWFEDMLASKDAVEAYKLQHGVKQLGEEAAWQHFFEQNKWIFGLALSYHFNDALTKEKLEVYTVGSSLLKDGKRPDAVMATTALLRSLCFVEIKTPRSTLMGKTKYRSDVWGPSEELAGAVAQSQKAVYRSVRELGEHFSPEDDEGAEHGASVYTVHPRSFVIIGTQQEFFNAYGKERTRVYASFELYRRGLSHPEVLTFDELLVRAQRLATPGWGFPPPAEPGPPEVKESPLDDATVACVLSDAK